MSETRPHQIHPQAVGDPKAELASGVVIGPGAVIGPDVVIGENTWIGPNAVLDGRLTIGRDNKIFPGACLGQEPQDLKYRGADGGGDRRWQHHPRVRHHQSRHG